MPEVPRGKNNAAREPIGPRARSRVLSSQIKPNVKMPRSFATSSSGAALSTAKASEPRCMRPRVYDPKWNDANRSGAREFNDFVGKRSVRSWCAAAELFRPNACPRGPSPQLGIRASPWRHVRTASTSSTKSLVDCSATRTTRRTRLWRAPQEVRRATSPAGAPRIAGRPGPRALAVSRTWAGPLYTPPPEHVRVSKPAPCAPIINDYRMVIRSRIKFLAEKHSREKRSPSQSEPSDADRRINVVPLRRRRARSQPENRAVVPRRVAHRTL